MREGHHALSVHKFAPEDSDPVPTDPALVAKLQQAAKLANENCDRAMALAHKLSTQLREAQSRINQLELEVSLRCYFPCGANPSSLARKADDRAWVINSLTDRIAAVAGAFIGVAEYRNRRGLWYQ